MALMKHREPNKVKWIGMRPGHNGTQVAASNTKSNGVQIIYTVTAGKIFYMTEWTHCANASAAHVGTLYVRDAADATVYIISTIRSGGANAPLEPTGSFNPPLEIPAGYDVCIGSSTAGGTSDGFVKGWEE